MCQIHLFSDVLKEIQLDKLITVSNHLEKECYCEIGTMDDFCQSIAIFQINVTKLRAYNVVYPYM